jgi:hypothetical protein
MHYGIEERDVARGLEPEHVRGVLAQRRAPRIDDDQRGATLRRLFEKCRGDG